MTENADLTSGLWQMPARKALPAEGPARGMPREAGRMEETGTGRARPGGRERYALQPAQFPHSQHAYERMFSVPLYTRMTVADVQRVCTVLREALS